MNILLKELVHQAAEFVRGHQYWGIREADIIKILDVRGKRNNHLVNPLNRDLKIHYSRPRQIPLTGEEQVYGEYLTMNCGGHDSRMLLTDFDSLKDMEKDILSVAGILNCWTTYVFAFINGQLSDYEVAVTCTDGSTYICDNNKEQNEDNRFDLLDVAKAELRWRQH